MSGDSHSIQNKGLVQSSTPHVEVKAILDNLDASALIECLSRYRPTGRKGYSLKALWRAYMASFLLDLPSTNALIRRLQDDSALRRVCGFRKGLPHRTTFNRFINRVADHRDLVEGSLAQLTEKLRAEPELEGLGKTVAVDSTTVRTHSKPNKRVVSDPEASWTAKESETSKDGKEWYFGYKLHLLVDARHGVPITGFTTTAKENDTKFLGDLQDRAEGLHGWFRPKFVLADRGYDSTANYKDVVRRKAVPIIPARATSDGSLRDGVYLTNGTPTCMGLKGMVYVKSDPKRGHLFRCRQGGCHLKARRGVKYCGDSEWFPPTENPRVLGTIHRGSKRWKSLYRLRQSVERVFKSAKESLRLERHFIRGLRKIALHCLMSVLAFQVTALTRLRLGQPELLRWMVRPVP